jgi:hypothetical protein
MQQITSDCAVWMRGTKSATNEKITRRTACQIDSVDKRRLAQRRKEGTARCNPAAISRDICQKAQLTLYSGRKLP